MRVKCLAQEHNTMSPARARTRSTRSGVERANHEATAPPTKDIEVYVNKMLLHKENYMSSRPMTNGTTANTFSLNNRYNFFDGLELMCLGAPKLCFCHCLCSQHMLSPIE